MSHLTELGKVNLHSFDVDAIKDACRELNLTFQVGGTMRWYYANRDQTKVDYVVKIEGCPYDVGIVKDEMGNLKLVYDKYQGYVENVLGKDCHKLVQSAVFHKIRRACAQSGRPIIKRQGKTSLFVEITV